MAVAKPATRVPLPRRRPDGAPAGRLVRGDELSVRPTGDWQVLGASTTGKAHLTRTQGNQDAFLMASRLDGTLLLAAADGAGSARFAARGASLAVSAALACLATIPASGAVGWCEALTAALLHARAALAAAARRERNPLRDYSCTLLLTVITPDFIAGLQVGDGAIIISSAAGTERLTAAGRGGFAGETVFITSARPTRQADTVARPVAGISAVALLTDGLEPVATLGNAAEPFAPFFTPLFSFAAGGGSAARLQDFLASDRIAARTHDDTTLLLAVRAADAS